jgi:hypothetical protein
LAVGQALHEAAQLRLGCPDYDVDVLS